MNLAVIIFFCLGARAADGPPAVAPDRASAPAAAAIADKLARSKASIAQADSESRRILGSLYAINRRMKKITREKSQLTDELYSVQGNAKGTARAIAELERKIIDQKTTLKRRLRALYKLSGENYVAILFSQRSLPDLDQAMRGLKAIADRDYQMIREYQRNALARRTQKNKLRQQAEKLVALEKRIQQQEGRLVAEHRAKSAVVSSLEASKTEEIARLQSLRATASASRGGDERIESLLRASFFESKGKLQEPVAGGALARPFGPIRDEAARIALSNKGWHIGAARGSPIAAIFDGVVAHSGWMNGYGSVVVIDHGDHYYSVYAHAQKIRVKPGDAVKKGQTFAEIGATAWRDGEGLYFEIRHFSDAEDPARWIRTSSLSTAAATGLANLHE